MDDSKPSQGAQASQVRSSASSLREAQGGQAQPRRRTRASSSFGPFQAVAQLIRTLCVAMVEKLLPAFAMLVGGSLIGLLAIVVFKPLAQVGGVLPQVTVVATRAAHHNKGSSLTLRIERPLLACLLACIPMTVAMKAAESATRRLVSAGLMRWTSARELDVHLGDGDGGGATSTTGTPYTPAVDSLDTPFFGTDQETVDWMNMGLSKMWQLYRPNWEATMAASLQATFDKVKTPFAVKKIEVDALTLSNRPMWIQSIKPIASRSNKNIQVISKVRYTGMTRFRVAVVLSLPGSPRVPVWFSDIDLDADMWFSYHLEDSIGAESGPNITAFEWAFTHLPKFSIQIKPLFVNLNQVPFLESWLRELITVTVPGESVLPKKNRIPLKLDKEAEWEAAAMSERARFEWLKRPKIEELTGPKSLEALVKPPVLTALTDEQREGFTGLVKVILLEADDIPGSTHDLFCSLSVGSYSLMSKRDSLTSERSKSGRAVWRQYFEFPIVEGSSDPLCIRLMDRTANGTTTMVGMGRLDVHSMTPGIRQDIKLNIQESRFASAMKTNGRGRTEAYHEHAKNDPGRFLKKIGKAAGWAATQPESSRGTIRIRVVLKKYWV